MDTKRVVALVAQIKRLTDELLDVVEEDREATLKKLDLPMRTKEEVESMVAKKLCLRCGLPLGDGQQTRGTHERCYAVLRRRKAIEQAELAGYCLPKATPGSPGQPAFPPEMLEEAKAKLPKPRSTKKKP